MWEEAGMSSSNYILKSSWSPCVQLLFITHPSSFSSEERTENSWPFRRQNVLRREGLCFLTVCGADKSCYSVLFVGVSDGLMAVCPEISMSG